MNTSTTAVKSNATENFPILVTGAAGFIAFHLIESLLRSGFAVVGLDNFDPFYDRSLKETNLEDLNRIARETGAHFSFYEQDICQPLEGFLPEVRFSAIYHLAARAGVRPSLQDPQGYLLTNELGTLQLLEFARKRQIQKFIFASSSSIYGNDTPSPFSEEATAETPYSPYAASKRCGEVYCRTYAHLYGIRTVCVRLFTVYGPRQRPDLAIHKFAKQISRGEKVTLFGDGTTSRDYTFVSDTVAGLKRVLAWLHGTPAGTFDVFNLGAGHSTSLQELLHLIESNLKINADVTNAPLQPGEVLRTHADITKAHRILGYLPVVLPSQGIPLFVKWFRQNSGLSYSALNQAS